MGLTDDLSYRSRFDTKSPSGAMMRIESGSICSANIKMTKYAKSQAYWKTVYDAALQHQVTFSRLTLVKDRF